MLVKVSDIKTEGRRLGAGSDGVAYVYKRLVYKVTDGRFSADEHKIAQKLKGRELSNVVKIHDSYYEKSSRRHVVVMQRLYPLTKAQLKAVRAISIWEAPPMSEWFKLPEYKNSTGKKVISEVKKGIRQLQRVGIQYNDLHRGNVMRTSTGVIKLIDFSRSDVI